jgi:hypothetical protein
MGRRSYAKEVVIEELSTVVTIKSKQRKREGYFNVLDLH